MVAVRGPEFYTGNDQIHTVLAIMLILFKFCSKYLQYVCTDTVCWYQRYGSVSRRLYTLSRSKNLPNFLQYSPNILNLFLVLVYFRFILDREPIGSVFFLLTIVSYNWDDKLAKELMWLVLVAGTVFLSPFSLIYRYFLKFSILEFIFKMRIELGSFFLDFLMLLYCTYGAKM